MLAAKRSASGTPPEGIPSKKNLLTSSFLNNLVRDARDSPIHIIRRQQFRDIGSAIIAHRDLLSRLTVRSVKGCLLAFDCVSP